MKKDRIHGGEGPDPVDWTGLSKEGPDQVEKDWIEWIRPVSEEGPD